MKHGHCRGMINLNWICSVSGPLILPVKLLSALENLQKDWVIKIEHKGAPLLFEWCFAFAVCGHSE